MDSGSVQADFFLPSIALDFMYICHALDDGFLNPFIHFIFILIEAVTAKDVAARKRWWCDFTEVFLCVWIIWSQHIPPRDCQDVVGIMRPFRAGLMKEVTQILDRSSAESPPMAGLFGFPLRPSQRIFDQVGTDVLGVAIPGVRKIPKGGPGVFSLADTLVGVDHGIDGCRERGWFFVPVSIILCHHSKYLKRHDYPRFPSKSQRRACSMLSAFFCSPPGKRHLSTTCCACSRVRIRVFESSIAQSARSLSRPAAILRARMYSRGGCVGYLVRPFQLQGETLQPPATRGRLMLPF